MSGADVAQDALAQSPLELTIGGDVTVKANFAMKNEFALHFGSNSTDETNMGTLTAQVGDKTLTSGEEIPSNSTVTFTAAPADGYLVAGWYSDADMKTPIAGTAYEQNKYVLDGLNGITNVYVKFEKIPSYDITVGTDGSGNGSLEVYVDGTKVEPVNPEDMASVTDGTGTYSVKRTARWKSKQHQRTSSIR